MNATYFDDRLAQILQETEYPANLVDAVRQYLDGAGDWELYRINPIQWAHDHGFTPQAVLNFFIHGSRLGLFDFSWSMVCPFCGEIQNNDQSINGLKGTFHCTICNIDQAVNIDDTVEVTFAPNPAVRALKLDPFESAQKYNEYHFSRSIVRNPRLVEYVNSGWKGFEVVPSGKTGSFGLELEPGKAYRFVSAGVHSQFVFQVLPDAGAEAETHTLDFSSAGMPSQVRQVNSTRPRFEVTNHRAETVGLMIVEADFDTLHKTMFAHPSKFQPFLNGNQLLSNQVFRDRFRIERLSPTLKLNIRSLTLLFTDLKGSTEIYDLTGDVDAYTVIQEHFELLTAIVNRHSGAIIKTMGDAIMASFARPLDAVKATLEMLHKIQDLKVAQRSLELKIGLHEGPALVINNQGQLDYFGQTVNIAARVQGLAGSNSVWLTDPILFTPGVRTAFKKRNFSGRRHTVNLKGVGKATTVYELLPGA